MDEIKITDFDAIDLRLLTLLQTDASRSNQALAAAVGISAPTCLRRVKRLWERGVLEKQVAILAPQALSAAQGPGLQALVEVTLERQHAQALDAFEHLGLRPPGGAAVLARQPRPDFVLVLACRDMSDYLRVSQALFTQPANVRNAKAFFATKRAKFGTQWDLG